MTSARPRYPKPDRNQAEIIDQLTEMGLVVWNLSSLGGNVLDIVVFGYGRALPVEIKFHGLESDLTEGEAESIRQLSEVGVEALVASDAEQIVRQFDKMVCGHLRMDIRGSGVTWHCGKCEQGEKFNSNET